MAPLHLLGWFLIWLGALCATIVVLVAFRGRTASSGSIGVAAMLMPVAVLALGVGITLAVPALFVQTTAGMAMVAVGLVGFVCALAAMFLTDAGVRAIGAAAVATMVMILGFLVNAAALLEGMA